MELRQFYRSIRPIALIVCLFYLVSITVCAQIIREPAYAGRYYPGDVDSLRILISNYIQSQERLSDVNHIKVLIVPHYPPGWNLTASGFKQIEGTNPETIVLISNYHSGAAGDRSFDGIAIDSSDYWRTPISDIPLNRNLANYLVDSDEKIIYKPSIFREDWTIELLLPFLQTVVNDNYKILPILFGNNLLIGGEINDNYKILSNILSQHLKPSDIVIISNDMAHNFKGNYNCEESDRKLLSIIESGNCNALIEFQNHYLNLEEMHGNVISCGIDGIKTGLDYFKETGGGQIRAIDYGHSDIDGYFVGYASIIMFQSK